MADPLIFVEATINMQGINRGQVRSVNPESPWVKENLAAGFLLRVTADGEPIAETAEVPDVGNEAPEDRAPDIPAETGDHDDQDETEAVVPADLK